jgi:septum formation protein
MTERLTEVGLASISPRRLALLASLGLQVTVLESTYDERDGDGGESARDMALRHAVGKAAGAKNGGPRLLVTADTIVDVDGAALGKPRDRDDAKWMLGLLSGRRHVVHTGFVVVDRATGSMESGVESTAVTFVVLDGATIDRYVQSGEPLDKAGAYGIQGLGALLVERVDGDFYTVMGLPLARLGIAWRRLGFEIP